MRAEVRSDEGGSSENLSEDSDTQAWVPPVIETSKKSRTAFFDEKFPDFWHTIGTDKYGLYDVAPISRSDVSAIKRAASAGWHIYTRVAEVLRNMSDKSLTDMGIPKEALEICRMRSPAGDTIVGRFDMIETSDGFKIIEFNAETPYFNWETHEIAGAVARSLGYDDPNEDAERLLVEGLRRTIERSGFPTDRVAVTAYNAYRECRFTAEYVRAQLAKATRKPVRFAPIHELRVDEDGVFDAAGRIDILYRCYPLEFMALDEGGPALFEAVRNGKVLLINPPSALLLQNKLVQAIIWGLMERNTFFTDDECELIRTSFLPSYCELPEDNLTYVRKPVFGREGSGVSIVNRVAGQSMPAAHDYYSSQTMMYQRWVKQPTRTYHVDSDIETGNAVHTCFVIDGVPTAVGMRTSTHQIIDALAYFLPLGYERETS